MAHPINPQTGRMMARSEPFDPVVQLAIKLTAERQASQNEKTEDFARTDPATDKIIEEILAERRRQDAHWGGAEHDDELDTEDWATTLRRHVSRLHKYHTEEGTLRGLTATEVIGDGPAPDYRERLVKITALAVAALESYDRKAGK